MTRFPDLAGPLGLGVGLDLPWGAPAGFDATPGRGEHVADRVVAYLTAHAATFRHVFISWQPRHRARPRLEDYAAAWDDLFARIPSGWRRALHQTAFNLGALEPYDTTPLVDFTNRLAERYGFAWVNEDLGLWSLDGRPLPYPLPPYLTEAGLDAAIRNTTRVQSRLAVPLLVEFPGFSDGTSFYLGKLDAYDFFREVVVATGSPATLDTGHLLSWRWLQGARGEALYGELERLPLASCYEIHLSGCAIKDERFMDYHHGILMDEQLELLGRLVPRCPNLRAITYEDPRMGPDGAASRRSLPGFERLCQAVARWV